MKRLRFILLSLLFALVAGCGGAGDSQQSSSVLNRGLSSDPESLDVHKARSIQALNVLRDIGEGLTRYTADGVLEAAAAVSWEVSDDGLTYTFKLRPESRWSNGDAVIADHYVYSFKRLADPATAAFYADLLSALDDAAAPDDLTLVINLKQPTPYLLSLLTNPATFPLHPGMVQQHGENFARPGKLLSNGAYLLKEWVPGSMLTLERNSEYWQNDSVAIDEVRYHVLTQEMAELARYRAGELDITSSVPPEGFKQVQEQFGDQLHVAPYVTIYYYGYNLTKPPFKDSPKLRQALSMAIDRELLVEKVTARGETPAYSWVAPGISNYTPTVLSYAALTQDERNQIARSLYSDAGYSAQNPLQVELRYNTSDTQKRVALAIQAMWHDVLGVEVTLINEEFQVLIANMRAREVTQVFRSSWRGDYNDAHTFLSILQTGNPANTPGYSSDEFDSLMQRAANQPNLERRRLYLEEAERVMLADHPAIPIYFYVSKHLVSPRVQGWGDNVLDYHYSQHLSLKAAE